MKRRTVSRRAGGRWGDVGRWELRKVCWGRGGHVGVGEKCGDGSWAEERRWEWERGAEMHMRGGSLGDEGRRDLGKVVVERGGEVGVGERELLRGGEVGVGERWGRGGSWAEERRWEVGRGGEVGVQQRRRSGS